MYIRLFFISFMSHFIKNAVIIIPARLNSTRLPEKALININGVAMIVRVLNIAKSLNLCDVYVATDSNKIANVVTANAGKVILTDSNLESGTDRIFQALQKIEQHSHKKYDYIVNLQGDMPNIKPYIIEQALKCAISNQDADIMTVACEFPANSSKNDSPHTAKVALCFNELGDSHKALYFSRSNIPHGNDNKYCQMGLYVYRQQSLQKFASLRQSKLELLEKLEQLRALENDMKIYCTIVKDFPDEVNVIEDVKIVSDELLKRD